MFDYNIEETYLNPLKTAVKDIMTHLFTLLGFSHHLQEHCLPLDTTKFTCLISECLSTERHCVILTLNQNTTILRKLCKIKIFNLPQLGFLPSLEKAKQVSM